MESGGPVLATRMKREDRGKITQASAHSTRGVGTGRGDHRRPGLDSGPGVPVGRSRKISYMKSFNEYFENKQLVEERREVSIIEDKKKKKIAIEQQEAGWNEFTGNQNIVEAYVDWITRDNRR